MKKMWEDEQGLHRYYYLRLEEKRFPREVKGSIPSCDLSISSFCCKPKRICQKQKGQSSDLDVDNCDSLGRKVP